jgi:hypothetical protein
MKKILTLFILLLAVITLAACSQTTEQENTDSLLPSEAPISMPEPTDEPTSDITLPPMDVSVGDRITFGDYTWRILDIMDDRALILSEDIIELRPFHDTMAFVSWATSDIRTYLNGEFLDGFDETERVRISETTLINNVNPWFYGSDVRPYLTEELLHLFEETDPAQFAEVPTNDFVFLLSLDELIKYFGDSGQVENPAEDSLWWLSDVYDGERVATVARDIAWEGGMLNTGEPWMWWLRTHGYDTSSAAVMPDGVIGMNGANVHQWDVGLRPAMWLDLH